jgi:hypothetical protein
VLEALGYSNAPELLRLAQLGDDYSQLRLTVGLTTASTVSRKVADATKWRLKKPPTPIFIVVNPRGRFATPESIEHTRTELLADIAELLERQGIPRPDTDELSELVNIQT